MNFILGENTGKLLVDIAREQLLYKYNPEQAVKTLTDSLDGLSRELALEIILGKFILTVDDDRVTIIGCKYDPNVHKDNFPPLDIDGWSENKLLDMKSIAIEWSSAIKELKKSIVENKGVFDLSVKYENLIKFFYDEDSENLIDIDNNILANIKCCILGIKNFVNECMKTMSVIGWLHKTYPDYVPESFTILPPEVKNVSSMLFKLMTGDENINELIQDDLEQKHKLNTYINKQLEINKIVSEGIKPVEITDGYNAGWLAPDGTFYGLNGTIANMLHNQIADALLDAGIINIDGDNIIRNPDIWLEQNGWVKIHGNWILFDGWNLCNLKKENIAMTEKQKDAIYKYGQTCCDGLLKLGYSQETISAARFNMTDLLMLKKYFDI